MEFGLKVSKKYSFSTQAATTKINKILDILSEKSLSRREIASQIHASFGHTRNYLNYLISEKKIYISSWKFDETGKKNMFRPCYRLGNKKNKPKPAKLTCSQRAARYREKLSKDLDRLDRVNMKRRLRRSVIKPDWTATWLMNNA